MPVNALTAVTTKAFDDLARRNGIEQFPGRRLSREKIIPTCYDRLNPSEEFIGESL
jgi:hypothetical protein